MKIGTGGLERPRGAEIGEKIVLKYEESRHATKLTRSTNSS